MKQVWNSDTVKQRLVQTNRQAHEEAAGMGLCPEFFALNKIDPDAPYVPENPAESGFPCDKKASGYVTRESFEAEWEHREVELRAEFDQQLQQKLAERDKEWEQAVADVWIKMGFHNKPL